MDSKLDQISLLNLLRARNESAFTRLVEMYHVSLIRLARIYVRDARIAEEMAQETWLAVLHGLDHFEGRSSLKTWIFTILTNKAKMRGQREKRSLAFSDFEDSASDAPAVDPNRFIPSTAERLPNHWAEEAGPVSWAGIPEELLLSQETMNLIRQTINELPENQRTVISLRDMNVYLRKKFVILWPYPRPINEYYSIAPAPRCCAGYLIPLPGSLGLEM